MSARNRKDRRRDALATRTRPVSVPRNPFVEFIISPPPKIEIRKLVCAPVPAVGAGGAPRPSVPWDKLPPITHYDEDLSVRLIHKLYQYDLSRGKEFCSLK